jgi:hypothetical protein
MAGYRFRRVSKKELRRVFNERAKYWERVQTGELDETIIDNEPAARKYRFPAGTRDQTVWYYERTPKRRRVAVVHQFCKPNGRLAASGKPDPKWVLYRGTIYAGPDRWGRLDEDAG